MKFLEIVKMIRAERIRQDEKWGADRALSMLLWNTILAEEVGEVARGILDRDENNVKEELVQVAAVCVAILENFDLAEF